MSTAGDRELRWYRVLGLDELPEGRVTTVTAGHRSLALTHFEGQYGALDNRCPHQGGPLGEGSIEKGLLRCPWHGGDYSPLTGKAPGFVADYLLSLHAETSEGASDAFHAKVRARGLRVPEWWHHRLVLDERGQRMAKRDESLTLRALRETGVTAGEIRERLGFL